MAFEQFQTACSSDDRISSVNETNLKIIFEQVLFLKKISSIFVITIVKTILFLNNQSCKENKKEDNVES